MNSDHKSNFLTVLFGCIFRYGIIVCICKIVIDLLFHWNQLKDENFLFSIGEAIAFGLFMSLVIAYCDWQKQNRKK